MQITETELIRKRLNRVIRNQETAEKLAIYKDKATQKTVEKLTSCSRLLTHNSLDELTTWYCKSKLCLVCNAIRSAKLINRFEQLQGQNFVQVVLTVQNFEINSSLDIYLKTRKTKHNKTGLKKINCIDLFQNFWNNTAFKKHYKASDYTIIRTFEITQNKNQGSEYYKTLHPHYHLIVLSHCEHSPETIGKSLIYYWLKYMKNQGIKVDPGGQYCKPPEKTIQENFKYITKIKDASPEMLHWIVKNTANRRLFCISGVRDKIDYDEIDEEQNPTDLPDIITRGLYYARNIEKNWYTDKDGKKQYQKVIYFVNDDTGEFLSNKIN